MTRERPDRVLSDEDKLRYLTLALIRRYGVPVTRERYIYLNYMGSPPSPENWTAECEEEQLPPELQDWSRFERPRRKRRRRR